MRLEPETRPLRSLFDDGHGFDLTFSEALYGEKNLVEKKLHRRSECNAFG